MKKFAEYNNRYIYNTELISAFPGTGKSYFFKNNKDSKDSDSSKFDKKDFPNNYIKHIKENIGKYKYIFISSHKEVRNALIDNKLHFTLIYPDISLKSEYINRYKERGNNEKFINLLENNWDNWIKEMDNQKNCKKIKLNKNEYISDKL